MTQKQQDSQTDKCINCGHYREVSGDYISHPFTWFKCKKRPNRLFSNPHLGSCEDYEPDEVGKMQMERMLD